MPTKLLLWNILSLDPLDTLDVPPASPASPLDIDMSVADSSEDTNSTFKVEKYLVLPFLDIVELSFKDFLGRAAFYKKNQ